MKKVFSVFFVLLAFVLTIGCLSGYGANKTNQAYAETSVECSSKAAYLCDFDTMTVLYEKNQDEKLPIASMCKIMTLILCFDEIELGNISLSDEITVSENAAGMGGSQVFLETGGVYKAEDLIKSIIVASANDACVAMAERICGNEDVFVTRMNEKAKSLNMYDTFFINCTGLPGDGQYSCAKDVATMFSELIKHQKYYDFSKIWMDEIRHPGDRKTEISNTNKLVRFYDGCDGGKTGYTSIAGHCIAATAKKNDMRLISVIIDAPDGKTRFKEASSLFDYGFSNYCNKLIINNDKPLNFDVKISNGKQDCVEVFTNRPVYLFSKKNERRAIETEFVEKDKVCAPIKKGDVLGELRIYENGKQIDSVDVVAGKDVLKKNFLDNWTDVAAEWNLI